MALQMPPKGSRLLREPDPTFIKNLKERMIRDPVGPGAAPLALLSLDKAVKEDFNSRHKAVEVLGGLHTFLAKSQLSVELPDNEAFKRVHADVYVGLTDDEAM